LIDTLSLLVWVLVLIFLPASSSSSGTSLFFLSHIASRLSLLNFDWLAVDFKGNIDARFDSSFAIKCDETETSWATCILIHHEGGINDSTELHEVLFKILLGSFL
jgi:hypothetical protein